MKKKLLLLFLISFKIFSVTLDENKKQIQEELNKKLLKSEIIDPALLKQRFITRLSEFYGLSDKYKKSLRSIDTKKYDPLSKLILLRFEQLEELARRTNNNDLKKLTQNLTELFTKLNDKITILIDTFKEKTFEDYTRLYFKYLHELFSTLSNLTEYSKIKSNNSSEKDLKEILVTLAGIYKLAIEKFKTDFKLDKSELINDIDNVYRTYFKEKNLTNQIFLTGEIAWQNLIKKIGFFVGNSNTPKISSVFNDNIPNLKNLVQEINNLVTYKNSIGEISSDQSYNFFDSKLYPIIKAKDNIKNSLNWSIYFSKESRHCKDVMTFFIKKIEEILTKLEKDWQVVIGDRPGSKKAKAPKSASERLKLEEEANKLVGE